MPEFGFTVVSSDATGSSVIRIWQRGRIPEVAAGLRNHICAARTGKGVSGLANVAVGQPSTEIRRSTWEHDIVIMAVSALTCPPSRPQRRNRRFFVNIVEHMHGAETQARVAAVGFVKTSYDVRDP